MSLRADRAVGETLRQHRRGVFCLRGLAFNGDSYRNDSRSGDRSGKEQLSGAHVVGCSALG